MYIICKHNVNMGMCKLCKPDQFFDATAFYNAVHDRKWDTAENYLTGITVAFVSKPKRKLGMFDMHKRRGYLLREVPA